jgi:Domain of unknown function (DUF4139)/N-terminal domain of unknown function (DUF4140)
MRRWRIALVVILGMPLLAALVPVLWSGGNTKEGAATASKNAKSRIDKVTVYPNSALVTREVEVPAGTGLVELVVAPMPDQIVTSSLYSEGENGLRILTTRFTTRQVLEDTSEARRNLESVQEKYQVIAAKIESEINSCQKNIAMIAKLENVAEHSVKSGDEVIAISKYVMEQRTERAKEMVVHQEQKRLNLIQLNFIQRKMGELGRGSGKMERDAVIVVDRTSGQGGKIRLNYLVSSVTWRPEYKVRAGKWNEDVQLDYLANLMQHSGEDWNQVKMTLSTAEPMLNATPPELSLLQPILMARGTPGAPPMPGGTGPVSPFAGGGGSGGISQKAKDSRAVAQTLSSGKAAGGFNTQNQIAFDKLLNEAAACEQNLELMKSPTEVLAELKKRKGGAGPAGNDGPSVTYHLTNKLTVPSRNDEQVLEVVKLKLAPKYYYKTVPVLNTHVYRLADLVNQSEHVLLPGEATMYQGTDFVGRMPMPLVAIGEEFTAGFGVDTQLQVQRQMVDQTRTTQGGNQVLKYDYRILVSSFKTQPVKLQVWDRLPKGENENIGIVLIKTTPELSKDAIYERESKVNNLLRWDVEVPSSSNGERAFQITYEFRMELDRQMAITGFQSK